MERQNIRREPRIETELEVTLQTLTGETVFKTKNVSYQGIYIVCPEPLPLQKMVRFKTTLPNDEKIQMLGFVAHTLSFADATLEDRPPGMGIHLYSLGKEAKEKWRAFVRKLYDAAPDTQAILKKMEYDRLPLHFNDKAQLQEFAQRDFSVEPIFIPTSTMFPVDTKLLCELVHPDFDNRYAIEATVVEVIEKPQKEQGLWVLCNPLDDARVLEEFIAG